MEAVISCVFFLVCFRKSVYLKFGTKTMKRKRVTLLSFFAKKLPKGLIFYKAYNKNEKDEYPGTNIHKANFIVLLIWKRQCRD